MKQALDPDSDLFIKRCRKAVDGKDILNPYRICQDNIKA